MRGTPGRRGYRSGVGSDLGGGDQSPVIGDASQSHPSGDEGPATQESQGLPSVVQLRSDVALLLSDHYAASLGEGEGQLGEHGHLRKAPGHHGVEGLSELRPMRELFGPAVQDLGIVERQEVHDRTQEGHLLADRLDDDDAQAGEGDLQWQAGEARSAAHIQDTPALQHLPGQDRGRGEGVEEVDGLHVLPVVDGGQVDALIPVGEGVEVADERRLLVLGEGDAQVDGAREESLRLHGNALCGRERWGQHGTMVGGGGGWGKRHRLSCFRHWAAAGDWAFEGWIGG